MSYCTQQDMTDRFGEPEIMQLTDRNNIGVIDVAVLLRAISDASAEIDSYLAKYTLPLVTIPAVLVRICCDIARYYLYDDAMIDTVEKRYEAVIKYLVQVAKGSISLGVDSAGDAPVSHDTVLMQSDGSIFGRSNNGFI